MSLVDGSCGRLRPAVARRLHRRWTEQGIAVRLNGCPVEPGMLPQPLGNYHRVDVRGFPPSHLITVAVKPTMVGAAERHRELIAAPAPQRPRLQESQVMGVARLPPAEKARLRRHELQMGAI